jgi:hypothetical protein
VAHHRRSHHHGERIARDVVLRRPEPAGDDHDVGAGRREPDRLHDPVEVVAHRLVMQDIGADPGEGLRHPPGVRVRDLPQKELGPHCEDLDPHPVSSR